jgi:hypothetical protein
MSNHQHQGRQERAADGEVLRRRPTTRPLSITARSPRSVRTLPRFHMTASRENMPCLATAPPEMANSATSQVILLRLQYTISPLHQKIILSSVPICLHVYCFRTRIRTMGGQTTFGLAETCSGLLHMTCFSSLSCLSRLKYYTTPFCT